MVEPFLWPRYVLVPKDNDANRVPFSRSGGLTVSGLSRTTRTDRGFWDITYTGIRLVNASQRRMWNITREAAGGMAGLLAIPVWSYDTAPWLAGTYKGKVLVPHSDDTPHEDGSYYEQPSIIVEMVSSIAIGDTVATLRAVHNIDELSGIRFSYEHALYETGAPISINGNEWTVPLFPSARAAIPAGAALEVDMPTCLVHLASDREMDARLSAGSINEVSVSFKEAVDEWNDRATAT